MSEWPKTKVPILRYPESLCKRRFRSHSTQCASASSPQQLKHHRALRPNLGHPHLNPDLQALVDAEEERKVKMEEGLEASFHDYKVSLKIASR